MMPDAIAKLHSKKQSTDFEVSKDNWDTVVMFLRVETQWRVGMNGPTGLDYNAIRWAFEMYGVSDQREMFEGLQVMEAAALGAMNK